MATETQSVSGVFEQAFDNLKKAAEANVEMQQEMFRKWTSGWPGFPQPQSAWLERIQKFQKEWGKTVKEVLTRHREVLDEQYSLAMESLEEAFKVAQSSDPQEWAKRCEKLCRKSLDVMREVSETQAKELQDALSRWAELASKSAS